MLEGLFDLCGKFGVGGFVGGVEVGVDIVIMRLE